MLGSISTVMTGLLAVASTMHARLLRMVPPPSSSLICHLLTGFMLAFFYPYFSHFWSPTLISRFAVPEKELSSWGRQDHHIPTSCFSPT